ncbi:MAG: DUF4235 domain-containing protein [Propionicimonas sp.]
MNASQRLAWNIYLGIIGSIATVAAQKAVTTAWEVATGEQPPEPNDPAVPLRRALTWAVTSGVAIGLTQLLLNRLAIRWLPSRWTGSIRGSAKPQ